MNIQDAKRVIRDTAATYERHVEAAMVLSDDRDASIDDLFACLEYAGLPSELAKTAIRSRLEPSRKEVAALK